MTQCAFLLEVVVGELTLTHHHHHNHPHPVSPTICIKVGGGPSLLVPFLAPAFTSPPSQPDAEDGHYIFQRGKSSIFSASSQLLQGGGGRVRVEVLAWGGDKGDKGGVPAVLGRCDAVMTPHDLTSSRLGLRGKLILMGDSGGAIGHITLTLSLRNLGAVVPAVGNWGAGDGGGRSTTSPGHPRTYEESFDILQDASDPSPHTVPYHDLPNSEKIALKIASLQDPSEAFLGEWLAPHQLGEDGGGLAQPPPILYAGQDRDGARMWEEKMAMIVGEDDQQQRRIEDEVSEKGEKNYTSEFSDTHTPDSQGQHRDRDSTPNTHSSQGTNTPDTTSNTRHKHKQKHKHHRQTSVHAYRPSSIARPQGWLRSTPPAAISSAPPPRLNRSHLLRLAAVDPQLGEDLRAEVDRRVRERMKGLEADFLEQVEKLTARRRSQRGRGRGHTTTTITSNHRESVGCQTEGATLSPVPSREPSQSSSSSSSLSSVHTSHKRATTTSTTSSSHRHTNRATHTRTDTHRSPSLSTPKERQETRKFDQAKGTETNLTTYASSPKDQVEVEKPNQVRGTDTHPPGTPQRATSDLRVPSASRVKLGEMPKNVTYVIGSDGERVYGDGTVLTLEEEEVERRAGGGGGGGGGHDDRTLERERSGKKEERGGRGSTGGGGGGRQEHRSGERRESDAKVNTSERQHSTSLSHSSAKAKTPKSYRGQSLGSELRGQWAGQDPQPPREPSQDTWGLTYTIRAADYDPSSASVHQSTPSTHLTTPHTGSDDGGDGGESYTTAAEEVEEEDFEESVAEEEVEEEVDSATSRSAEVCQEIFKGRKADILSGLATSSPPPSIGESLLSPSRSAAESEPSIRGHRNLSPGLSLSPSPRPLTSKHKTISGLNRSNLTSSSIQNLSPSPRLSTPKRKTTTEPQAGRNSQRTTPIPHSRTHLNQQYKENIYSQNGTQDGGKASTSTYAQPSGTPVGAGESASGSVGSSISDISARIAALLVAKRVSVPRMNTDSVSSYVPSEEHPGTLSSVSDVMMSPSTSFSE